MKRFILRLFFRAFDIVPGKLVPVKRGHRKVFSECYSKKSSLLKYLIFLNPEHYFGQKYQSTKSF